jgi:hypothetical protein
MISLELRIHESPKATQASNFPPLQQEAVYSWNSLCELVGCSYPSIQTAILHGRQGNRVDSVTRHRDCGGTRCSPGGRHRPPRYQAREHFITRRDHPRFWTLSWRRSSDRRFCEQDRIARNTDGFGGIESDQSGFNARHSRIYVAGPASAPRSYLGISLVAQTLTQP